MPESLSLDSEAFHTLLTDALRAGPGSPEWHQAVLKLRGAGQTEQADELKLLMEAREALESGKEYRSVRAGDGFTRRVFEGIEKESAASATRRPTTVTLILYFAGIVGLGLVVMLFYFSFRNGENNRGIDELANMLFTHQVVQSKFTDAKLPPEWQPFGDAVDRSRGGLVFRRPPTTAQASGGVVLTTPLAADTAYAINVDLRPVNSSSPEIATIFLRDTPVADAGSGHELVFLLRGGIPQILLPDGSNVYQGDPLPNYQPVALSIKMDKDFVIIEADHKRLYAGPHELNASQDRYFGIRFQSPSAGKGDAVTIPGVLVQKP